MTTGSHGSATPPSAGWEDDRAAGPVAGVNREAPLVLSLQSASVRFGSSTALQSIDLQIRRGERVAIVGANGSGKTTLLRLLHGLLPAQARQPATSASPASPASPPMGSTRCAMVFQQPFLLNFSVARNVALGLWLAGVGTVARRERVAAALLRVGLSDEASRPARALSGGQQQRLAFARALALQPDVLFLDEPTSSLDPSAKREVESLIEGLGSEGLTTVLTSHNLGQVKRLSTRVLYLHAGRLLVDLPTDQFFSASLPPEAAQFLKGELPWQ